MSNEKVIPGSDKDLAVEITARFASTSGGRNGKWKKPLQQSFIDGALWMKERIAAPFSVQPEEGDDVWDEIDALELDKNYYAGYHWGAGMMKDKIKELLKSKYKLTKIQ